MDNKTAGSDCAASGGGIQNFRDKNRVGETVGSADCSATDGATLPVALKATKVILSYLVLKGCLKKPGKTVRKQINTAEWPGAFLGLGKRYRLGEVSFTLYNDRGEEGTDEVIDPHPESRDSLRRTISSAADSFGEPSTAKSRKRNNQLPPRETASGTGSGSRVGCGGRNSC